MPSNKKLLQAAAGNAGDPLYVEDVFSTYLYEGTGSGIAINNGIDLSGEGGLVIYRRRDGAENWSYQDTNRGVDSVLYSDSVTAAANPGGYGLASFNSNGFTTELNTNGADYASWTFRKAKKFFDIVTYTGNSTSGRTVSHNLGSVPACIIIKRIDGTSEWPVYHKDESSYGSTGEYEGRLNESSIFGWDYISGTPTDAVFAVTGDTAVNLNGATYVAYLFASDAGGFGDAGSENIIKCGSYIEPNNGSFTDVNLGFEPQFIIAKCSSSGGSNWVISDSMRGMPVGDGAAILNPNTSAAETAGFANAYFRPTATGFSAGNTFVGGGGETVIYVAIRRPMKTPESGTEVLAIDTSTSGNNPTFDASFPPDFAYITDVSGAVNRLAHTRLLQGTTLKINATGAEETYAQAKFDYMEGYCDSLGVTGWYGWMFKRGTGFMDVVAYNGTSTIRQQSHNLGVTPEFLIVRGRNFASHWYTYHTGQTGGVDALHSYMRLNLTEASQDGQTWKNYDFNASTFSLDADNSVNGSTYTYVAYLFATLAGVSKVGSYTGTGADLNVDCGFSAGARFILIKRTDSTGDWFLWDSLRGITAGNDPYLLLNTTAAEVTNTDYIDPLSSGFTVTSNASSTVNVSSGSYIFLAIA